MQTTNATMNVVLRSPNNRQEVDVVSHAACAIKGHVAKLMATPAMDLRSLKDADAQSQHVEMIVVLRHRQSQNSFLQMKQPLTNFKCDGAQVQMPLLDL